MSAKTRALLISPDGMLGQAWQALLTARGWAYDTVTYPAFDITRKESIAAAVRDDGWVINCCAFTDVDSAEVREDEATAVNGHGVGWLAERCGEVGATLVHYSTDYVFSGVGSRPYLTDSAHAPINAYGRSKALGERRIIESGAAHLLVRTSWLYAPWGKNFVRTIAQLSKQRTELKVVDDQRGRPTSAELLAEVTLRLMTSGAQAAGTDGVFHVCDEGECTWFDLAREVAAASNPACVVHPCSTAEFPRPARRPAYSVLDLSRTTERLGPLPGWRENVRSVLARATP